MTNDNYRYLHHRHDVVQGESVTSLPPSVSQATGTLAQVGSMWTLFFSFKTNIHNNHHQNLDHLLHCHYSCNYLNSSSTTTTTTNNYHFHAQHHQISDIQEAGSDMIDIVQVLDQNQDQTPLYRLRECIGKLDYNNSEHNQLALEIIEFLRTRGSPPVNGSLLDFFYREEEE
jgi:hypothetical protein